MGGMVVTHTEVSTRARASNATRGINFAQFIDSITSACSKERTMIKHDSKRTRSYEFHSPLAETRLLTTFVVDLYIPDGQSSRSTVIR